jgi:hypothetical protein
MILIKDESSSILFSTVSNNLHSSLPDKIAIWCPRPGSWSSEIEDDKVTENWLCSPNSEEVQRGGFVLRTAQMQLQMEIDGKYII